MPSNLPESLSSFVGRRADIAQAGALLVGTRLLTLTGAGGCGKTRLGRQVAAEAARRFPAGVWWIELAALTEGSLVADELARVLEVPVEGRPALEALLEHLVDAEVLVVLDNCEHLVTEIAATVDHLLRGTTALRVLATSRQPLEVEGETTWRVPSMTVPPPNCAREQLPDFDASRLFLERLDQSRPASADATDPGHVGAICRRLDGMPLALELAAARARTMSLERIVVELDDRFRLLTGGPRVALERHRTLHASVRWSYDLLDDDERVLLRRLAVFVGGFPADAADEVAGFAPLTPEAVLDVLTRLVDRSLVQFDAVRDRYRLLETIREYGRDRVGVVGETDVLAVRHLRWACRFAETRDAAMTRADLDVLDEVEQELPNLRVALDAATEVDDPALGLLLSIALTFFWAQRGLGLEGAARTGRILAAHPDAPGELRGRAHAAAAYDLFYGGDFEGAAAAADHGLAEATAAGDERGRARSRHAHGAIAFVLDPPEGRTAMAEAIELARSCGDRWCETDALQIHGFSHLIQHRPALAHDAVMTSAAMAEEEGNAFQLACHQLGLAMIDAAGGRLDAAAAEARRGADDAQRIGDPVIELWGRAGEVTTALTAGRWADLARIADRAAPPGAVLPPVTEAFVRGIRGAGPAASDPAAAIDALAEVADLLRTTFVPNEGLRLALIGAAGALAVHDDERAEAVITATLEQATNFGSALVGPARVLLSRLQRRRGDPATAERTAQAGLAEVHDSGLVVDLPDALEAVAGPLLDLGAADQAVRLLGAASAVRARQKNPGAFPTEAEADRAAASADLGAGFAARFDEGRRMDAAAAVAYARRSRGARRRPPAGWAALTPTELDVARLAADGLTNPAIADRLFVARGTVKTHLEHVYAKLGLHNRTELATALAHHQD